MCNYFFASWAKLRFGGWNWATGAVLDYAILRRGTFASDWLLHFPQLLVIGQFTMMAGELSHP